MDSLQRMDHYTQSASVNRRQADLLREARDAQVARAVRRPESESDTHLPVVRRAYVALRGRLAAIVSPSTPRGRAVGPNGMLPRTPSHPTALEI